MALSMEDVLSALRAQEPELGPEALPFLRELLHGADPLLASRATQVAGRIGGPGAVKLLREAAAHPDPILRVAAVSASRELPPETAIRVLPQLLNDEDPGVRRLAIRSAAEVMRPGDTGLRPSIETLSRVDPDPTIRETARRTLERLR